MNSFMIAMIQYNRSSKCLDGRSKELKLFGRGVEFCWHMLKTCCLGSGLSLINLYESIKNFSVGLFIHSHVHVFRSANNTPEPELFDKRNTKIYMKFWPQTQVFTPVTSSLIFRWCWNWGQVCVLHLVSLSCLFDTGPLYCGLLENLQLPVGSGSF